ncbi:unnamed protein product [Parnassius apollo]|uniref:(apollo) hypothetical protein n=1 Tax=Parnassius apollo TaxID=110799 RepID=A0A8S3XWZ3_PARAO|nr:unnamed protein product [Parnassius apollo]
MQAYSKQATNTSGMPYNFMISSDGETFEALGWRRRSPLFPQYSADALLLAFIDNYTQEAPKQAQILEEFPCRSVKPGTIATTFRCDR